MARIVFIAAVLLLGSLDRVGAQTAAAVAATQIQRSNSSSADGILTKRPSLSLNADGFTAAAGVNDQFHFVPRERNENKNERTVPFKNYNPISIPLW